MGGGGGYQSPVIVRKRVIDQAGEESRETEQNLYHSPLPSIKANRSSPGWSGVRGAGGGGGEGERNVFDPRLKSTRELYFLFICSGV